MTAITSTSQQATGVPPYQSLAEIYDRVVALPLFPLLCGAFLDATRRRGLQFSTVADLGCGTGTFSRFLARRGLRVTGVDRSGEMLDIARAKAAKLPGHVSQSLHYLQQDLREFELNEPVDLLTCRFNTINYFTTPKELAAVLKSCRHALMSPGYLMLDFITGERASAMDEKKKINHGTVISYWRTRTFPEKRLSIVQVAVTSKHGNANPVTEVHRQRWYSLASMARLLERAGFDLLDTFDLEALRKADQKSYWVQVLAKKTN